MHTPAASKEHARKRNAKSPAALAMVDEKHADNSALAKGINAIVEKLGDIGLSVDNNNSMLTQLTAQNVMTEQKIAHLNKCNNSHYQARLNDTIEITGFPGSLRSATGDVRRIVMKYLKEMSIEIELVEIARAYFREFTTKGQKKCILVVTFLHNAIKSRVMEQKLKIRNEINKNVYFNEALTPFNRTLVYKARQLKKAGKFSSVGSMNGQIYVKKLNGGPKIFVYNECEIEEISKMTIAQIDDKMKGRL